MERRRLPASRGGAPLAFAFGGKKVPVLFTVLEPGTVRKAWHRRYVCCQGLPWGEILGGSVSQRSSAPKLPGSRAARGSWLRGATCGRPTPSSKGRHLRLQTEAGRGSPRSSVHSLLLLHRPVRALGERCSAWSAAYVNTHTREKNPT